VLSKIVVSAKVTHHRGAGNTECHVCQCFNGAFEYVSSVDDSQTLASLLFSCLDMGSMFIRGHMGGTFLGVESVVFDMGVSGMTAIFSFAAAPL